MSRLFRWTADGAFSEGDLPPGERRAFLFCAGEVDAYAREVERTAQVSPAVPVAAPPPASSGTVGFPDALRAVLAGAHIMRLCWAGGTYVTMQTGYPDGIAVNSNTARATGLAPGATATFRPYLLRKEPQVAGEPPDFANWMPDQLDLFATDWQVLERR